MRISPEEQNALVQFFGTIHAQAKQTDDMIVGSSKFVNPVSPSIKKELEQVLKYTAQQPEPVYNPVYEPVPPPDYAPMPAYMPPEMHSVEQFHSHPQPSTKEVTTVVDAEVLNTLKEINLNLARIATTLEKRHGSTKRTKNTKSD